MDAEQYVSILENNLLSNMENSGISKESIMLTVHLIICLVSKLKTSLNGSGGVPK